MRVSNAAKLDNASPRNQDSLERVRTAWEACAQGRTVKSSTAQSVITCNLPAFQLY
uniref:Uncharacterized protein n=1 Tax=Anguilla anguilla TaxID=7936 RepID=A0A0E9SXT9_ANGAN